jgi:hypothetical protein
VGEHTLLLPFLNDDPAYCRGVELGMNVVAPMLRRKKRIKGYFRTENEEQIRLACYRMGYDLVRCKPWRHEGKHTGWVWMDMRVRLPKSEVSP